LLAKIGLKYSSLSIGPPIGFFWIEDFHGRGGNLDLEKKLMILRDTNVAHSREGDALR
jgi:hypothetical protein